jgi:hypothetical protein
MKSDSMAAADRRRRRASRPASTAAAKRRSWSAAKQALQQGRLGRLLRDLRRQAEVAARLIAEEHVTGDECVRETQLPVAGTLSA